MNHYFPVFIFKYRKNTHIFHWKYYFNVGLDTLGYFPPSDSSIIAAIAQKREHHQQQQKKAGAVRSHYCVFEMRNYSILLFHLFSANLKFHCCLDIITIRPYLESPEVTKLSEHCSSNKIIRWVWFIYLLRFSLCIPPYY